MCTNICGSLLERRDLESQLPKDETKHSILWTALIDVPLLLVVLGLIGFFELGHIPSNRSGFYCGDPALSFPFNGDTVTTGTLISIILLAPIILVFIAEMIFSDSEYVDRTRVLEAAKKTLWVYRGYFYGLIFNFAVIEAMKGIVGSPRPTFFALCEPDTGIPDKTCVLGEFVSTFECTSTKYSKWLQKDASHSFPSGHTSLSVHCGVFLAWYLQKRAFDWRYRTVFVVPFIQLACFCFSAVSSLTRITDRRHHWWDVLTGFFIGVITFLYAAVVLCKNFSPLKTSKNEEHQSSMRTLI